MSPKLDKLREERSMFMEFQRLEREIEHMMGLYNAWQFHHTQRSTLKAAENLEKMNCKVQEIQDTIEANKQTSEQIEKEIEVLVKKNQEVKNSYTNL